MFDPQSSIHLRLAPIGSDARYPSMSRRDHPRLVNINMLFLVVDAEKVRALSTFHGNFYDSRFRIGHDRMHSQAKIRKGRNQIPEELNAFFREAPADACRAEVDRGFRENQSIDAFEVTRTKSLAQFQRECLRISAVIGQRACYASERCDWCSRAQVGSLPRIATRLSTA